jgi:predicted dehydrogenase
MDKAIHIAGSDDFNVVFVGAGNIMFGSEEGPWNHSFRFEHKLGPRLKVVALIDPAIERATAVLQKKCDSFVVSAYQDTRVFKTLEDFVKAMSPRDRPRAVIVGSPPMFRGTTQPGRDIEMQIIKYFPGVAIFIEKPIATGPVTELDEMFKVSKHIHDAKVVCSVGYMLRYLKAVQMMKKIIEENNLTVMSTIARYACAYQAIAKPDWWDKSKSAGPIVEQGTHFCDLSRYFGGEVDIASVSAHSLEWNENAGHLSKISIDESKIAPENRIPRVTAATWKYDSGAVGSFTHVVALQGTNYSCELEVYADGYSLKLVNPYVQPVLHVRKPGDDNEQTIRFPDDDPFFSEVSNLIDVIEDIEEDPDAAQILSTYDDACRTYELTWAIREASERSRRGKVEASAAAK